MSTVVARLVRVIERLPAARRRILAVGLGELARTVNDVDGVPAMFFEERRSRGSRSGSRNGRARHV